MVLKSIMIMTMMLIFSSLQNKLYDGCYVYLMKVRDYYLKQERSPLIEWGAESDSSVLRLKKTDKANR